MVFSESREPRYHETNRERLPGQTLGVDYVHRHSVDPFEPDLTEMVKNLISENQHQMDD